VGTFYWILHSAKYCCIYGVLGVDSEQDDDVEKAREEIEDENDDDSEDDDGNDDGSGDTSSSIPTDPEVPSNADSELPHPVLKELARLNDQLLAGKISLEDVESSPTLASIKEMMDEKASHVTERTGRLWFMYMKMIAIVRKFITSERKSNWHLHLRGNE
jgi:hypothetical protein